MTEKKRYDAQKGIPLDADFRLHVIHCNDCKRLDEEKPSTVALLCLEGAVLWKRENGVTVAPEKPEKGDHWTSKQNAKRLMRYK